MKDIRRIHEALMDSIQAGRDDEAATLARELAHVAGRLPYAERAYASNAERRRADHDEHNARNRKHY